MFRCPNRIPRDPAAHHYLLIRHCESATAELLWALSQSHGRGEAGTSSAKVPLASSAQLSCPQPIQPSLCLIPTLGSSVTALELLGSRGRNVGMCSKYRASTNHWGIRAGQGSQCQLPGTAGTEEFGLHLAWHIHAGWMTTGFPKVSHLPESITLFQSPNSKSLSNPPISQTYSGGRTLGFHSLETPESFLSSSMNSQVC